MLFYIEPNTTTSLEGYYQQELMNPHIEDQMLHYMLNNPPPPPPSLSSNFFDSNSFNKLLFSDTSDDPLGGSNQELARTEENSSLQRGENLEKRGKNKRKRATSKKTSEQVESQRMTHIAVERNRRKQMNQHLNILRSIMPNSYVQRGDQASIIGGAIEFVRELEQLLECLESEKRRRIYGDDRASPTVHIPNDQVTRIAGYENETQDETAESNSWFANVQVKVVGCDGLIMILSRKKSGMLSRTIAAIEGLQLQILNTSVTTIEHSVLSSFNFKMSGEARLRAEDIADSIQQILSSIHANSISTTS